MDGVIINGVDEKTVLAENGLHKNRVSQRSEMAQEIISRTPDFMEKWALLIFFGILLLLLAATWFIKYPDIIEARATLTAANAPKEIVPRQEGRLVRIFKHNNEKVIKNEIFGWIESTADHEEVIALSRQLDSCIRLINMGQAARVAGLFNRRYGNLGEIQQGYQQFIVAWQLFNDYMVNGFYARKMKSLQNDVLTLDSSRQIIVNQKELTQQDVKLAEETYNMNKTLVDDKVLSKEEFRAEKSKYVNKQLALPQLDANLFSNQTQKRDKLKELDQLSHDMAQQQTTFQQALQSLKSTVDDWKRKYLLQSPIDGRIFYVIPLQENQFIQAGKLLGYINPDESLFYWEVYLPQSNFGKIDTGFKVQLRLDAYPYQEAGFVEGTLNYISGVASDSGFMATVRLDNGLVTNSNKHIPYRSGLKAQAIVITRNMRLLQRLWYKINKSTSVGSK